MFKMMKIPLIARISMTSLSIITFAISLLVFLTYFKYEATLYKLVRSRFEVVLDDVRNTITSGLSLGVTLKELQTTQTVIQKVKASDPQILSIKLFEILDDATSITVFNTRQAGIGGKIPDSWLNTIAVAKANAHWYLRQDGANIVGTRLVNNFDRPLGGIAVRYSQGYLDNETTHMLSQLILYSVKVLAGAAVIVSMSVIYFFRPISRCFIQMRQQVEHFLVTETLPDFKPRSELEEQFSALLGNVNCIMHELTALKTQMQ